MDFYSGARGCLCGPEPFPGRMSPDLPAADRFCWVPSLPHQGAGGLCRTGAQDASPAAASMLGTCAEGRACALTRGSGGAEQRLICLHSPSTFEGPGWACAHAHACPYRREEGVGSVYSRASHLTLRTGSSRLEPDGGFRGLCVRSCAASQGLTAASWVVHTVGKCRKTEIGRT